MDRFERLVIVVQPHFATPSPHLAQVARIACKNLPQGRYVFMKNPMGWVYVAWMLLIAGSSGCSESPPPIDVEFLASDLHFLIGGQHIVTPAVAIGRPGHSFDLNRRKPEKTLKQQLTAARNAHHPMLSDQLDMSIRQYQYLGVSSESQGICPLLTRKWSQSICIGAHEGLLRRLPERFQLLDRSKLELLQYHWTVGKEREYDQVKDMELRPGVTEIGCDRESKFCTAAVNVLPGLLAVWTVWSDEPTGKTARTMADEQGAAIVQFVRRALAPVEDPTLVDEG